MAKKNISPERQNLVQELIKEFNPKTAGDVQDMLKELFAPMLQGMLEGEMDDHLGYSKYERNDEPALNTRNGHSRKTVSTSLGDMEIDILRDRDSEFEPVVVPKHQRDISDIEDKVISMYAKGMTTRDISGHLNDIYGIEASAELISKLTDRVMPAAREWQSRPLDKTYIVMFLDAIHYHVKQDHAVIKKTVYIAVGIKTDGTMEVMGMYIGGNESAKYWVGVLNDLKTRGAQDILIACVDGLTGFGDAIKAVYPHTDIQRCIVHQIRYSSKFVVCKDRKEYVRDIKPIYQAQTQELSWENFLNFEKKWGDKYPGGVRTWRYNWSELTTFFEYPPEIRKLIYTTNSIEGFNRQLRKVTKTRTVFPTDDALFKILYLAMMDITAKWTAKPQNWALIMSQLLIFFPDRLSIADF